MKEMTIKEKAKAYDNLLAKLQKAKVDNDVCDERYCCVIDDIVPELKESEDDRIRKEIIAFITTTPKAKNSHKEWISWLEKQGEHANFRNKIQVGNKVTRNEDGVLVNLSQLQRVAKPAGKQGEQILANTAKTCKDEWRKMRLEVYQQASGNRHEPNCSDGTTKMFSLNDIDEIIDKISEQKTDDKVEPKFKVGDWVVGAYCAGKITELTKDSYLLDTGMGIPFSAEHNTRLWTIKDANDGDVLACSEYRFPNIIIYGGYINNYGDRIGDKAILAYCGWNGEKLVINKKKKEGFGGIGYVPATKEQRELLFSKMKEAGYEWDAEKKELKKIEQNLAWSEEDEREVAVLEGYIRSKEWSDRHIDMALGIVDELVKKLKALKDRYTWKPSDVQMKALNYVVNLMASSESPKENDYYYNVFKDLREQLKKLIES